MTSEKRIKAFLNPLQFIHADDPNSAQIFGPISHETIVQFLCTPGLPIDIDSVVARYKEINKETNRIFVVPYEERIIEKLIWPLRHAKASYLVGNYLGTISLCGMVAEMLAILLFDITDFKLNNRSMDTDDQKALFGREYEKLGQERRIDILKAYGIINNDMGNEFKLIRMKRRRYLHYWSQDHESIQRDAVDVYCAAASITAQIIGQHIQDGRFVLTPAIEKYLGRKGAIESADETK